MKELREFVQERPSGAATAALDDDTLSRYIARATGERNTEELGESVQSVSVKSGPVELPHHNDLKPEYRGMYQRYDSNCAGQHWGTEATVRLAINLAYSWWKNGKSPTMLLGDISARNFADTGCHSAHKAGTHLDTDLTGTLPKDPGYTQDKQVKCGVVCWLAIQLGARRVLFSDDVVANAVNQLAAEKGLPGRVVVRADHDNHFHIEL